MSHCFEGNIRNILLTGASGFLGIYLLEFIQKLTTARTTCLIRSNSLRDATQKLASIASRYSLPVDWSRVTILTGDLAKPSLGLGEDAFHQLQSSTDLIIHAGADVSLFSDYEKLKPPNIDSLETILKMASGTRLIPLTHVSSYSVFNEASYNSDEVVFEKPLSGLHPKFMSRYSGYAKSKWMAERLCENAVSTGTPVRILRLPYLLGDFSSSSCNPRGQIEQLLKAVIKTSLAPEIDFLLTYLPVDLGAELVVRLSLLPSSYPNIYHLTPFSPIAWSDLIQKALAENSNIIRIPADEWSRQIKKFALSQNGLFPAVALTAADPTLSQFHSNIYRVDFDCRNLFTSFKLERALTSPNTDFSENTCTRLLHSEPVTGT